MEVEEAPGHVQAGGDGRAEGRGVGLEEDGPRTVKSICEIIMTVHVAQQKIQVNNI